MTIIFLLIVYLIIAILVGVIFYQTAIGWLVVEASIDLQIGKCEVHIDKKRHIWSMVCSRH